MSLRGIKVRQQPSLIIKKTTNKATTPTTPAQALLQQQQQTLLLLLQPLTSQSESSQRQRHSHTTKKKNACREGSTITTHHFIEEIIEEEEDDNKEDNDNDNDNDNNGSNNNKSETMATLISSAVVGRSHNTVTLVADMPTIATTTTTKSLVSQQEAVTEEKEAVRTETTAEEHVPPVSSSSSNAKPEVGPEPEPEDDPDPESEYGPKREPDSNHELDHDPDPDLHHEQLSSNPTTSTTLLQFTDYIELQTRLVLLPYVEDKGTGAIIASYQDNRQLEGLIVISINQNDDDNNGSSIINDEEIDFRTADFTDILAALRETPSSIRLELASPPPPPLSPSSSRVDEDDEEEEELSPMIDVDLCDSNIENDDEEEDKQQSQSQPKQNSNNVNEEEKKDDVGDLRVTTNTNTNTTIETETKTKVGVDFTKEELLMMSTPRTTNIDSKISLNDRPEPRKLFLQPPPPPPLPIATTFTRRQLRNSNHITPSKERTKAIHTALDDHYDHHILSASGGGGGGSSSSLVSASSHNNNNSISSGMSALSAWGLRVKAQSEKLAANAMAMSSTMATPSKQQQQQQQHQKSATTTTGSSSAAMVANSFHLEGPAATTTTTQLPIIVCDMYIQTNVGAYLPISTHNYHKSQLKSVTTSSLFCIRKSPTEPCIVTTATTSQQQHYSFQWYRSSSNKTQHTTRSTLPVSPSKLYDGEDFIVNTSIDTDGGDGASLYSSGSFSSGSSSSSSSGSYSTTMSSSTTTAGISRHTISSINTKEGGTTACSLETHMTKEEEWIPLPGATNPSFQPNTTLVGKKLRCLVTIRRARPRSDYDRDRDNFPPGPSSISSKDFPSTASAIMNADDDDDDDDDDNTDTNINDVSLLDMEDDDDDEEDNDSPGKENKNIAESDDIDRIIICTLIVPIEADMVLFNGAQQAMMRRGSATFGNFVGRGGGGDNNSSTGCCTTPATATLACGKTFRIEVSTARKIITYQPTPIPTATATATATATVLSSSSYHQQQQQQQQRTVLQKKRKTVNVNSVHLYCRSSSQEEYVPLTDIPLLQVTAIANPTNPRQVDLLFPAIPPRIVGLPPSSSSPSSSSSSNNELQVGDGSGSSDGVTDEDNQQCTTHRFLEEYCITDHASSSSLSVETGSSRRRRIPRLELETPNRMTRESFLLALGIANYQGKPAQLNNRKVLYRDALPLVVSSPPPPPEPQPTNTATVLSESYPSPQQQQQLNSCSVSPPTIAVIDDGNENHQTTKSSSTTSLSPSPAPFQPLSLPPPSQQSREQPSSGACRNDDDSLSTYSGGPLSPFSNNKNIAQQQHAFESMPTSMEDSSSNGGNNNNNSNNKTSVGDTVQVKELQHELEFLRAQLTRKEIVVTELQRQVNKSDTAHQKTKQAFDSTQNELKQSQQDCERIQLSKRHIERSMQSQYESAQQVESKHTLAVTVLEEQIQKRDVKITELEKNNRTLQNEKAVLGASVEARESKLVKLEELQTTNVELSQQVAQQDTLRSQLEESKQRNETLQQEFEANTKAVLDCRTELDVALHTITTMKTRSQGELEKASSCHSQLGIVQKKNQQLQGERNNYKQKNESLSKEVARLCRGGRNMQDIHKIVADHDSFVQETELLRVQKRKAVEDAHMYRTLYEQVKAVEEMSELEQETRYALERTTELERLLAEMTEYVSAKEMQFETMREVNVALQEEIHHLAQANLRSNEV